jgi:hypothetical protein
VSHGALNCVRPRILANNLPRTEHLLRKWISREKRARHGEERDGYRR